MCKQRHILAILLRPKTTQRGQLPRSGAHNGAQKVQFNHQMMSGKQTSRLLQSGRLLSWFVQQLQLHHQDPCLPRCFSGNLASTQQHGCDCARPRPAGALITSCTCSCQPVLLTGTVQPELSSAVLQLHGMRSSMPAASCLQGGLLFSVCYPQRLVAGGLKAPAAILCLNLCLYYLQGHGTAWQRCAA